MTDKRIIISGGGTGGHVFPAIAIANAIKRIEPDVDILFVGANGKIEMDKVPAAGYKIIGLPIQGFRRSLSFKNFIVIANLLRSLFRSIKIIRDFKPDLAIGVGGYASAPVLFVASRKGVPALVQEQNSYAGLTNKLLARYVEKICVAYPGMERFFAKHKIVLTGNPVRKEIVETKFDKHKIKSEYGLKPEQKMVLLLGGSGGAKTINDSIIENIDHLAKHEDVFVLLQTGKYYYESVIKECEKNKIPNLKIVPFIDNMAKAYSAADLVVSRSGAGTISELCLLGKTSIFVPSPNVAENHQYENAKSLRDGNAAIIVKDKNARQELLIKAIETVGNPGLMNELSMNIRKFAYFNSDDIIAKEALALIKKKK